MSIILLILAALVVGILAGVSGILPAVVYASLDTLIMVMLCALLFVIGLDMSQGRTALMQVRRIGWKMVLLPVFIAGGKIPVEVVLGGRRPDDNQAPKDEAGRSEDYRTEKSKLSSRRVFIH